MALIDHLLGRVPADVEYINSCIASLSSDRASDVFDLKQTPAIGAPSLSATSPGVVHTGASTSTGDLSECARSLVKDASLLLSISDVHAASLAAVAGIESEASAFRPVHLAAIRAQHFRERLASLELLEALCTVSNVPGAPGGDAARALLERAVSQGLVGSIAATLTALHAPVAAIPPVASFSVFSGPGMQQVADAFAARHVRLASAWRVRETVALLRVAVAVISAFGCDLNGFVALATALHASAFSVPPQQRALALAVSAGRGGIARSEVSADAARVPHLGVMALIAALDAPAIAQMLAPLSGGSGGAGGSDHPLVRMGDRRLHELFRAMGRAAEAWIQAAGGSLPPDAHARYSSEQLAADLGAPGTGPELASLVDAATRGLTAPLALPQAAATCPYVPVLVAWSSLLTASAVSSGQASPLLLEGWIAPDSDEEVLLDAALRRVSPFETPVGAGGTPLNLTAAAGYLRAALPQLRLTAGATARSRALASLLHDSEVLDVQGAVDGVDRLPRLMGAAQGVVDRAAEQAATAAAAAAAGEQDARAASGNADSADADDSDFDIDDVMVLPSEKAAAQRAGAAAQAAGAAASVASEAVASSAALVREVAAVSGGLASALGAGQSDESEEAEVSPPTSGGSLDPAHDSFRSLARQALLAVALARHALIVARRPAVALRGSTQQSLTRLLGVGPDALDTPFACVPGLQRASDDAELSAVLGLVSEVYAGDAQLCGAFWAGLQADEATAAGAASLEDDDGGMLGAQAATLPSHEPLGRWLLDACLGRAPFQLAPLCQLFAALSSGAAASEAAARFLAASQPVFAHVAPQGSVYTVERGPSLHPWGAHESRGQAAGGSITAWAMYSTGPLWYAADGVIVPSGVVALGMVPSVSAWNAAEGGEAPNPFSDALQQGLSPLPDLSGFDRGTFSVDADTPLALMHWPVPYCPLRSALSRLTQLVPALAQLPATLSALQSAGPALAAALSGKPPQAALDNGPASIAGGGTLDIPLDADGGMRGTLATLAATVRHDSTASAVAAAALRMEASLADVIAVTQLLTPLLHGAPAATLSAINRSCAAGAAAAAGRPAHWAASSLLRAAAVLLSHTLPCALAASPPNSTPGPVCAALSQLRLQAQRAALSALHLLASSASACAGVSEVALLSALSAFDSAAPPGGEAAGGAAGTGSGTLGALVFALCASATEQLPQPLGSAAALCSLRFTAAAARAAIAFDARAAMAGPAAEGGIATSHVPKGTAAALLEACADAALRHLSGSAQTRSQLQASVAYAAQAAASAGLPAPPLSPEQTMTRKHCWLAATRSAHLLLRVCESRAPACATVSDRVHRVLVTDPGLSGALVLCASLLAAHATPAGASVLSAAFDEALPATLAVEEQLLLQGLTQATLRLLTAVLSRGPGGSGSSRSGATDAGARAGLFLGLRVEGLLPGDSEGAEGAAASGGTGAFGEVVYVEQRGDGKGAGEGEEDMGSSRGAFPGNSGLHLLIAYCGYRTDVVPVSGLSGDGSSASSYLPSIPEGDEARVGAAAGHSVSLAALSALAALVRCMTAAFRALGSAGAAASPGGGGGGEGGRQLTHDEVQRGRLHYDAGAQLVGLAEPTLAHLLPLTSAGEAAAVPSHGHAAGLLDLARACMDGQEGLLQILLAADSETPLESPSSAAADGDAAGAKRVRFTGISPSGDTMPLRAAAPVPSPASRSVLRLAVQTVLSHEALLATSPTRPVPPAAALRAVHASLALLLAVWRSAASEGHFLRIVTALRALAPSLWPAVAALARPQRFLIVDPSSHSSDSQTVSQEDAAPAALCAQAAAMDLLATELLWAGPHHEAAHRRHHRRTSSSGAQAGEHAGAAAGSAGASMHALLQALGPLLSSAAPSASDSLAMGTSPASEWPEAPLLMSVCGTLPAAQVAHAGAALRDLASPQLLAAYHALPSPAHAFAPKARFGVAAPVVPPAPAPFLGGVHRSHLAASLYAALPAPTSAASSAGDDAQGPASGPRSEPSALGRRYVYDVDSAACDAGHAVDWLDLLAGAAPAEVRAAIGAALEGRSDAQGFVLAPTDDAPALHAGLCRMGVLWLLARWNGAASLLAASADAMASWQGLLAAASRLTSVTQGSLPPASLAACSLYLLTHGVTSAEGDGHPSESSVGLTAMVTAAEAATVLLGAALEAPHGGPSMSSSLSFSPSAGGASAVPPCLQLRLLHAASELLGRLGASKQPATGPSATPALRLRLLLISGVLTIVNRLSLNAEVPPSLPGGQSLPDVLSSLASHACESMSAAAEGLQEALSFAASSNSGGAGGTPTLAAEVFAASASFLARVLFLRPAAVAAHGGDSRPGGPGAAGGPSRSISGGISGGGPAVGSPVHGLGQPRRTGGDGSDGTSTLLPLPVLLSPSQVSELLRILRHSFVAASDALADALALHDEAWLRQLSALAAAARSPAASRGFGVAADPALNELRRLCPADADIPAGSRPQFTLIRFVAQLSMRLALQLTLRYSGSAPGAPGATSAGAVAVTESGLLSAIARSALFRRVESAVSLRLSSGLLAYPFAVEGDGAKMLPPPSAVAVQPQPASGEAPTIDHMAVAASLRAVGVQPTLAFAALGWGLGPSPARGYEGWGSSERCSLAAAWCDALGVLTHAARGTASAGAPSARSAAESLLDVAGTFRLTLQSALLLGKEVTFAGAAEASASAALLAAAFSTRAIPNPVDPVLAAIAQHGGPAGALAASSTLDLWLTRSASVGACGSAPQPASTALAGQYLVRDLTLLLGTGEGGPCTTVATVGSPGGLLGGGRIEGDAGVAAREHLAYRYGVRVSCVSADERRAENSSELWRKVRRALLSMRGEQRGASPRAGAAGKGAVGGDAAKTAATPAAAPAQPKSILKHAPTGAALPRSTLSPGGLVSRQGSFSSATGPAGDTPSALGTSDSRSRASGSAPASAVLPMRAWRDMVEAALTPALASGLALCAAAAAARSALEQRPLEALRAALAASAHRSPPRGGADAAYGAADVRQLAFTRAMELTGRTPGMATGASSSTSLLDTSRVLAGLDDSGMLLVEAGHEEGGARHWAPAAPAVGDGRASGSAAGASIPAPLPVLLECLTAAHDRIARAERGHHHRQGLSDEGHGLEDALAAAEAAGAAGAGALSPEALFAHWPAEDKLLCLTPEDPHAVTGGRWLQASPGVGHVLAALSFALHRARLLLLTDAQRSATEPSSTAESTPTLGGRGSVSGGSPAPRLALRGPAHPGDATIALLAASSSLGGGAAASPLTGKTAALTAVAPLSGYALQSLARSGLQLLAAAVDGLTRDPRLPRPAAVALIHAVAGIVGDGGLELVLQGGGATAASAASGAGGGDDAAYFGSAVTPGRSTGGLGRTPSGGLGASPYRPDSGTGDARGGSPMLVSPAGTMGARANGAAPARRLSGGLFRSSVASPPGLGGGYGGGAGGDRTLLSGGSYLDRTAARSPHLGGSMPGGQSVPSQATAARRALECSEHLCAVLGGTDSDAALVGRLLPLLVLQLSARVPDGGDAPSRMDGGGAGGGGDPLGRRLQELAEE